MTGTSMESFSARYGIRYVRCFSGYVTRLNQGHLEGMYGTDVSRTPIFAVTDAVSGNVTIWQARLLDALYPIIYLDCIHVEVRDRDAVRTTAGYRAIAANMDGHKQVLGR
jgi:putative transposase